MKKKDYTIIVNVNLEYHCKVETEEEAIEYAENVELPSEYVSDSFEIVKVIDDKAEEDRDFKRCSD
jgi:hypothetical protein